MLHRIEERLSTAGIDTVVGHEMEFVLVGPDGVIRWRADYGGAPKYTMFLPTDKMLADLSAERLP